MESRKPAPVSVVANDIRDVMKNRSSTDFSIYYDDHTVYGDLQYIRTKVRAAWQKKSQENYKANDHRVDAKEKIQRPDLFAGELEFAMERLDELLDKIEETDDFYDLTDMLERHQRILSEHKKKADNGELYYSS